MANLPVHCFHCHFAYSNLLTFFVSSPWAICTADSGGDTTSSEISGEDLFLGGKGGTSIASSLLFREPPLLCFLTLGDELKLGQNTYVKSLHRLWSGYKVDSYRVCTCTDTVHVHTCYIHVHTCYIHVQCMCIIKFKFNLSTVLNLNYIHAHRRIIIHDLAPTYFSSVWLIELRSPVWVQGFLPSEQPPGPPAWWTVAAG